MMKRKKRDKRQDFKTIYIGVDPGKTGGISALAEDGTVLLLEKYPGNEILCFRILERFVKDFPKSRMVAALEKVGAMPKQGGVSMFNFGANFGQWQMLFTCFKIKRYEPRPQEWQKGLGLPSKSKVGVTNHAKAKAAKASEIFPECAERVWTPRGAAIDGVADALMIADWLRRKEEK